VRRSRDEDSDRCAEVLAKKELGGEIDTVRVHATEIENLKLW
jgi:hypothetical protein